MKSLGEKIKGARKSKHLTQEELSELSKINLRTIQRIENDENTPRGQTLNLICNALDLNISDFQTQDASQKNVSVASLVINGFFLILLNIVLMMLFGYSTLDTGSNLNSKICAFLLSFLIPFFIVYKTQKMNNIERLLKFGSGFIFYILTAFFMRGFLTGLQVGLFSGLFPCLIIALSVLYYDNYLIKPSN